MELQEAILKRRTVRSFSSKPVSDELLMKILEAGTWAPSHGNNQPWEFLYIGPETRSKLADEYVRFMDAGPLKNPELSEERKQGIRKFAQTFGNAPVLLAVTCRPTTADLEKYDFPLATAAAIQNIFLSAWENQIAGIWLSIGMNPNIEAIINIPAGGKIAGVLALGYPEVIPPAQPRTSAADKFRRLP